MPRQPNSTGQLRTFRWTTLPLCATAHLLCRRHVEVGGDRAAALLQSGQHVAAEADAGQVLRLGADHELSAPLAERARRAGPLPPRVRLVEAQEHVQPVVVVSRQVVGQEAVQLGAERRQRRRAAERDGMRRGRPARRRQRPARRPATAHRLAAAGLGVLIAADTGGASERGAHCGAPRCSRAQRAGNYAERELETSGNFRARDTGSLELLGLIVNNISVVMLRICVTILHL